MKSPFRAVPRLSILAFAGCLLAGSQSAFAVAKTWTGSLDGDWANAGNWNPSAPVSGSDNILFGASGTVAGQTINTNLANISLNSAVAVTFSLGASAYTIGTIGGGVTWTFTGGGITNSSTALQTINVDLDLGATVRAMSANTGDITLGGTITGTGGLSKSNTGTLTLNGTNTYSGNTTVSGGTLVLGSNGALGTSILKLSGGTTLAASAPRVIANEIQITSSTPIIGGTNSITFSGVFTPSGGSRTVSFTNAGGTTIAGPFYLSGDATARTFTISGSANVLITGKISNGTGGATSGQLKLNGTNVVSFANSTSDYNGIAGSDNGVNFVASLVAQGGSTISVEASATGTPGSVTAGPLGTGVVNLRAGFIQAGGAPRTVLNNIVLANGLMGTSGSNDLTLAGSLTLTTGSTFTVNNTGLTTIAGNLILRDDAIKDARTLNLAGSGPALISGNIVNGSSSQGVMNITNNSAGGVTLAGNNTYTGATTIAAGTLVKLGHANGLGNSLNANTIALAR
jgi:fibronectin-binding autotransporter adhesin